MKKAHRQTLLRSAKKKRVAQPAESSYNRHSKVKVYVPPHLIDSCWMDYETESAYSLLWALNDELKKLQKKVTTNHVHKSRVALRRWFSIWAVLEDDGFKTKELKKTALKPLRELLKMLGSLRDLDVIIETAADLGCPDDLLSKWADKRKGKAADIEKYIEDLDVKSLIQEIDKRLKKRHKQLGKKYGSLKESQSAFWHIDKYISIQEDNVRTLSDTATTPDELHQLRLAIKGWRYLLTEFFGLTNLALVTAQQLLGEIHDLDRLTPLFVKSKVSASLSARLKHRRNQLVKEFEQIRYKLPYGLRPQIVSMKYGGS